MNSSGSAKSTITNVALIAPCGMNCRLCRAYARDRTPCPGCRSNDGTKSKACMTCPIKNCKNLVSQRIKFCFSCDEFPCARLEHMDKRYRSKYGMSVIDNLLNIRELGIRGFVSSENDNWRCLHCGNMLCVHKPQCPSCGSIWHQFNRQG